MDIGPLVALLRMLSCDDNVRDCLNLQIPVNFCETLTKPVCLYDNLPYEPSPHWRAVSTEPHMGRWDESTLLGVFAPILLGMDFHDTEGMASGAFKRVALISGLGWSVYLPTIEFRDPHLITPFQIKVRRGVPVRNGDIRRRIEDPGSPSVSWPAEVSCRNVLLRGPS